MTLVVHAHFHPRRSGATTHVEAVVPSLGARFDTFGMGRALGTQIPRIGWRDVVRRARREPTIWHAHRLNELVVGLVFRWLCSKLKVVYTRHGHRSPDAFSRWFLRRADLVIALTQPMQARLALPAEVVPHGVDLRRFSPPADRPEVWASLGLGGASGIGVVGRVRPDKGQGDFTEAVTPMLIQSPEWRAVLVGLVKPVDTPWALRLVEATGGRLVLAGEQVDPVPWYQGLSIVVQPSHAESYSFVVLEAMASGCCVVAARLEHFPAFIDDGRTGFFYTPGKPDELRDLLQRLMADPTTVEAVGKAAAAEVRQRFMLQQQVQTLGDHYERLLAGAFTPS